MASPFGQAPAAGAFGKPFAFGTPGATPGLFGASPSTPGFGGTPTPGFGAAPSAFGAPTGGFGFTAASSAAAFGAASTPAFGATPTAASTPDFGAFSFNTAASAASGASSASPFAPSAAPMFGGNTFGQSSPGLFGSSPAPPFGSSFGAASSAAGFSFSTTGAFGSSAPAALAQSGGGMFGATTQMAPALFSTGAAPDAAIKEMGEVRAAYMPSSSTFKFQHLFLNVVDNPAQRVKPANVDEIRWRQVMAQAGGPNNPDKLWPVLAVGFKDLLSRAAAQQQGIEENQQRLKSLTELAHRMSRQHTIELKGRTAEVQKRHIELSHRLLHVTRLLDALESRLASSLGYRGDLSRSKEQDLSRQLAGVETEVAPGSTSGLQRRLQTVSSAARLRSGLAPGGGASAQAKLDEKSLQQLFAVLKEHAEGVRQLQEVLKRDQLDIQIMKQHVGQGA